MARNEKSYLKNKKVAAAEAKGTKGRLITEEEVTRRSFRIFQAMARCSTLIVSVMGRQ